MSVMALPRPVRRVVRTRTCEVCKGAGYYAVQKVRRNGAKMFEIVDCPDCDRGQVREVSGGGDA